MGNKLSFKVENLFIIFCLFFGFVMLSIVPLFHTDDEEAHFEKIYSYSEGVFNYQKCTFADGKTYPCSSIPVSILKMTSDNAYYSLLLFDKDKIAPLEKDKKDFLVHMVPSYTVLSYLPQIAVLKILKALNIPPFYMMYILRILSLLIYTAIVYCAVRITPVRKHLFAFCGLVPTALYLAGGISTDGIIISACFLYTAYVFYLAYSEKVTTVSKKNLLLLTLLLIFITACKFPYGILALLMFVIPKEKFSFSKNGIILTEFLILIACSALITGLYLYNSKGVSSPVPIFISPSEAVKYAIHNPLTSMYGFLMTLKNYLIIWLVSSIAVFNAEKIIIPFCIILFYAVALLLCGFYRHSNETDNAISRPKNKIIYFLIAFIFFTVTYFVNYLLFSDAEHHIVINFQGRYLVPLLPVICLLFAGNSTTDYKKLQNITVAAYFVLIFSVLIFMLNKFFV